MKKKKIVALMLGAAMIMASGQLVMAESTLNLDGVEAGKNVGDAAAAEEKSEDSSERSIFDVGSTDIVSIEDGVYTVTTEYATTSITPAFGWVCLTQDISQQMEDWSYVFEDPRSYLEEYAIPDGDHYILTDSGLNIIIFHEQGQDYYSNLIRNSSEMTPEDDEVIIDSLLENSFPDYASAILDAGEYHYLCFLSPDGMSAFYETVVDGVNYDFLVYSWADDDSPLSSEQLSEFEEMLGTFTITPVSE